MSVGHCQVFLAACELQKQYENGGGGLGSKGSDGDELKIRLQESLNERHVHACASFLPDRGPNGTRTSTPLNRSKDFEDAFVNGAPPERTAVSSESNTREEGHEHHPEQLVALDLRLAWAAQNFGVCQPGDERSRAGWYDSMRRPKVPVRPDSIRVLECGCFQEQGLGPSYTVHNATQESSPSSPSASSPNRGWVSARFSIRDCKGLT